MRLAKSTPNYPNHMVKKMIKKVYWKRTLRTLKIGERDFRFHAPLAVEVGRNLIVKNEKADFYLRMEWLRRMIATKGFMIKHSNLVAQNNLFNTVTASEVLQTADNHIMEAFEAIRRPHEYMDEKKAEKTVFKILRYLFQIAAVVVVFPLTLNFLSKGFFGMESGKLLREAYEAFVNKTSEYALNSANNLKLMGIMAISLIVGAAAAYIMGAILRVRANRREEALRLFRTLKTLATSDVEKKKNTANIDTAFDDFVPSLNEHVGKKDEVDLTARLEEKARFEKNPKGFVAYLLNRGDNVENVLKRLLFYLPLVQTLANYRMTDEFEKLAPDIGLDVTAYHNGIARNLGKLEGKRGEMKYWDEQVVRAVVILANMLEIADVVAMRTDTGIRLKMGIGDTIQKLGIELRGFRYTPDKDLINPIK